MTSVNDAPVAVGASRTLAEDAFEAVTLAASDVEGDALTYTIVDAPLHGILSGSGAERTYTPVANYNGPDSFTFKASDGALDSNVATVSLTVTPVNDAPNAVNDAATVAEDGSQSVDVRANDSDVDGNPLTITLVGLPIHGTAVLQGDGNVLYTPNAELQRLRLLRVHDLRRRRRHRLCGRHDDRDGRERRAGRRGLERHRGAGHR